MEQGADPNAATVFAPDRIVTHLEECNFYHTMDVPGFGTVQGPWDLRGHVDAYLGKLDFRSKRVLEVGTASGFLCIEMEKRGADVVAYDLSDDHEWDVVPFARLRGTSAGADKKERIRRLNNSWWLVHRAYNSPARVVYGSVYDIPRAIGEVDIASFGCVLLHLRDPFLALARVEPLVRETIVIMEPDIPWHRLPLGQGNEPRVPRRLRRRLLNVVHWLLGDRHWWRREELLQSLATAPLALFLPNHREAGPSDTWWFFRPKVVCEMLGVLGFPNSTVTYCEGVPYNGQPHRLYTIVAHRG